MVEQHTASLTLLASTAKARQFLTAFEHLIEANFTNVDFDLRRLADQMGLSERQVQRKLRAYADRSFSECLRTYRLKRSLEMLRRGSRIAHVARAVGFRSQSYFTTCFKAEFRITPSQFQKYWQ